MKVSDIRIYGKEITNYEVRDVTVIEHLTKLISNGIFIQETLDKKENIYIGKYINKLREVLFKN